jgi:transposase
MREKVEEITLDMATNMQLAARLNFPNAALVTDRFHVVKLAMEAVQHLRIKLRWQEIDIENKAIKSANNKKIKYIPFTFDNEDSPKQLLARSRYILAKKPNNWTDNQRIRAEIYSKIILF